MSTGETTEGRLLASSSSQKNETTTIGPTNFLAAFAVTVLFFVLYTGFMVLILKIRRRQRQRAGIPFPTMQKVLQQTLALRLFVSSILALLLLLMAVAEERTSDDDNDDNHGLQNSNLWIMFLYVVGVLVAVLLIAVNHMLYWTYFRNDDSGDQQQSP